MKRRIYFDIHTGELLVDTGETQSRVSPKTIEEDIATFTVLSQRNRESFDFVELEYGQYQQDFIESQFNFRVNPTTKKLEFSYPTPGQPEAPPVFEKPLSEQVKQLRRDNGNIAMQLADAELKNSQLQSDLANLTMNLATKGVI